MIFTPTHVPTSRACACLPLVSWLVDTELRITAVLGAPAAYAGDSSSIAPTAFLGSSLYEYLVGDEAEPVLAAYQHALRGESIRLTIPRNDRDFLVCISPVYGQPDGVISGCVQSVTEVTALHRLEETLFTHDARFRAMFDNGDDRVALLDDSGRYWAVNRCYARALGDDDPETVRGTSITDWYPAARAHSIMESLQQAAMTGVPVEKDVTITRDGEARWFHVTYIPLDEEMANRRLVMMVGRDITEHKRSGEMLWMSEARFRALFDSSDDCLLVWDRDYHYIYANQAAMDYVGVTSDQVYGKTMRDALAHVPEFMHLWMQRVDEVFRSGATMRVTDAVPLGDRIAYSESVISPIRDAQGDITAVGVVYRDVTERTLRALDLRLTSEKLTALINSSPLAILDTWDHCIQTIWNPAAEEIFGWKKEEVLGKPLPFIHPDRTEQYSALRDLLYRGEAVHGQEAIAVRADGSCINIVYAAAPLHDAEGNVIGCMGIISDTTELHTAVRQRQQSIEQLRQTLQGAVEALAHVTEWRDPYTAGHQQRVKDIAVAIGREMQLSQEQIELLGAAALLHDIGKVAIPIEILSKPGSLNEHEYNLIKIHAKVGAEIVQGMDFPWPVADLIRWHHVTLDGKGYPQDVDPATLGIETRILTAADVVESMSSHRPYRAALGLSAALEELRMYAGIRYDADVVAACVRLFNAGNFAFLRS